MRNREVKRWIYKRSHAWGISAGVQRLKQAMVGGGCEIREVKLVKDKRDLRMFSDAENERQAGRGLREGKETVRLWPLVGR